MLNYIVFVYVKWLEFYGGMFKMIAMIDRKQLKAEMRALLADAEISPKVMTALYAGLLLLLSLVTSFDIGTGLISTFVSILSSLLRLILNAGFVLYCMAIRRGERAEYLTLFDGFSFTGKLIALNIIMYALISLWSMLFVIPGIIAAYRYRFALYNLYENPGISVMEALAMSKRQTMGYKMQLFTLDLSYAGWIILAMLPSFFESTLFYYEEALPYVSSYISTAAPLASFSHSSLPLWLWSLIISLWSLVVGLFYLAHYQCTELGYFEIAKSTSGVNTQRPPWSDGPDDMGGF